MHTKLIVLGLWMAVGATGGARPLGAMIRGPEPGLPVVVMAADPDSTQPLVVFISGDGGWKDFDPRLAAQFVARKCPVVALNALHYFWSKRTPDETTAAVTVLVKKYMKIWDKHSFILAGFSFGADVLPFVLNRLAPPVRARCKGIALFSPGTSTDFEIHVSQMLSSHRKWSYDVVQEIAHRPDVPMLCFFGSEEHTFPVDRIAGPGLQVIYLAGGHHYEANQDDIAEIVLKRLGIQ